MQVIKVEIHVKSIFKNIAEVTNNGVVIGFLTDSKDPENPVSAVFPNGENLGDFDCHRCACSQLHLRASNVDPQNVIDLPDPLELIAALMLSAMRRRYAH